MSAFTFKTFYALALAYLLVVAQGAAITNEKRDTPGFLKVDFKVEKTDTTDKRDGTSVIAKLVGNKASYLTDVYVGSDKQKSTLIIDTGSSDTWLRNSLIGNQNGGYNPRSSSTHEGSWEVFKIKYGDLSSAVGSWAKDDFALSPDGPKVGLKFGDVTLTSIQNGLIGIGYTELEASAEKYPNYPQALADAKIINKNAYSLYLDDYNSDTGSIIFGGIDHAKYTGKLVEFPPVGESNRLNIQLNSIGVNGKTIDASGPHNLDSGTTITYVPVDAARQLAEEVFGAGNFRQNNDPVSPYYIHDGPCPSAKDLSFNFNGLTVNVPPEEWLLNNGGFQCVLAIVPHEQDQGWLLGDNFLRSAYVVYDLQDHKISVAQIKHTQESNISVIS